MAKKGRLQQSKRRLLHDAELLTQLQNVIGPKPSLAKPRERPWKRGVVPSRRQPKRVVHDP